MKLLLDENLPKRLKIDFADHEVYTFVTGSGMV
jgi:predicted nuclease of predicted toxin-antitoxin system